MNTPTKHNQIVRDKYRFFCITVSLVLFILLPLTSVHAAGGKKINGKVREAPGVGWPYGVWIIENSIEDRRVMITEQTEFKSDKSDIIFGANIIAKGHNIDGVFIIDEIKIKTDDALYAATR